MTHRVYLELFYTNVGVIIYWNEGNTAEANIKENETPLSYSHNYQ